MIHADAARFQFPSDDIVMFLYNSFRAKVMSPIVDRVAAHGRRIYVLYANPECAALFNSSSSLMSMGKVPGASCFCAWKNF